MSDGKSTNLVSAGTPSSVHARLETVLLVEDEPMLAEVFRRILVNAGFEVSICRSGMDALLLLEAEALSVDVVLSDVRLPVISGDRLAREIRRLRPELPVLLMTGFSATITQENAHALGVAAVLQKPLGARMLVTAIREALLDATRAGETCGPSSASRQFQAVS